MVNGKLNDFLNQCVFRSYFENEFSNSVIVKKRSKSLLCGLRRFSAISKNFNIRSSSASPTQSYQGSSLPHHPRGRGQIDPKEAYFSVSLRFQWQENLCQFRCLCFGLSSAPRVFTKLMKALIPILRRLNIVLILHLDDSLLIARTQEEITIARDTLIFLL